MNGGVSSLLKSNQKAQTWKWAQYRSGGNFVKDCVAKSIVEVMVVRSRMYTLFLLLFIINSSSLKWCCWKHDDLKDSWIIGLWSHLCVLSERWLWIWFMSGELIMNVALSESTETFSEHLIYYYFSLTWLFIYGRLKLTVICFNHTYFSRYI